MAKTIKKETEPSDDVVEEFLDSDDFDELPKGAKSIKDVMAVINKKFGERTMYSLGNKADLPRLPTGVHAVDYITAGGLPITQSSGFHGGFSGGKTTLALNTIQVAQNLCFRCYRPAKYCVCSEPPLKQIAVVANVEGTLDKVWAKTIGVDVDSLVVLEASGIEEYIDISRMVLASDEVGLFLFDSVGAAISKAEFDNAADASNMGKAAFIITKMAKTFKQILIDENKRGHLISFLYINQRRLDLKKSFGNPESLGGGEAIKHEQSLLIRCGNLTLADTEKVYKSKNDIQRDTATKHSAGITRTKVYTLGKAANYVRSVDYHHPELGNVSGKIMDFKFLVQQAKASGLLGDDPKKYVFMDKEYKTQVELMKQLNTDFQDKLFLSMMIVEHEKQARRA